MPLQREYRHSHIPRRCTPARYQCFTYTDAYTSPLFIGEISVFLIYRRTYLAVVHRRDTSLRYIQTHIPRREISVFLIYRRTYLAVVYGRDTSLRYVQTHLPRRCTSARYQSFLYTDTCTSPLYIGEEVVLY